MKTQAVFLFFQISNCMYSDYYNTVQRKKCLVNAL